MTLFLNGEILTSNAMDELCEAMLIEDGRIVFVGDQEDAMALADADAEIIDLKKRAVIPGFINTYPIDFSWGEHDAKEIEKRARELLSLGYTTQRLSADSLAVLRRLVGNGEITATSARCSFSAYERAELLSDRCRLSRMSSRDLQSDCAVRQAEWAISDRRPIALEAGSADELHAMLSFFSRQLLSSTGSIRNRIYLHTVPHSDRLTVQLPRRLLPVFLDADHVAAECMLSLHRLGIPGTMASSSCQNPLELLSKALTPLDDDYRNVPSFISSLTSHAAKLESVADELGSLEWGKRADFLVLSAPLIGCPPSRLPALQIVESWVDGCRLSLAEKSEPLLC